jgi:hypothetical protein
VDLFADLAARRDGHDDQLRMPARPQHPAEVGALLGNGGDRELLHGDAIPASWSVDSR